MNKIVLPLTQEQARLLAHAIEAASIHCDDDSKYEELRRLQAKLQAACAAAA